MKNKDGFTLVELLAVIVLLAIIMTIAVPSVTRISTNIKENMYCRKIDQIENRAQQYGEDRRDSLTEAGTNITVKQLVDAGYVKKDQETAPIIVDPRNTTSTELYNMSLKIFIKYNRVYVEFNNAVKTTCGK